MNYRPSFASNMPVVVKNLLIINVLFFVATAAINEVFMVKNFSAFYFDSPFFKIWQPITYMFMHGGWMHIFFNMYAVYLFGSSLEALWGPKKFLQYYIFTGLGALALHMGINAFDVYQLTGGFTINEFAISIPQQVIDIYETPILGASGSVFGLLLAFGMLFPNVELMLMFIPIPIKAKYFVILYGLVELFMGFGRFQGDNVAHFAHLGGMLFGFILIKIWQQQGKGPKRF